MSDDVKQYVCQNRKARFDYEVIETLEAGIALQGTEIKSVREHHVSLDGSYASVEGDNVFLLNCNIEPYSHGNIHNHEPTRPRQLLLHRREIRKFAAQASIKGLTLVPLAMYLIRGRAKVELALCRGKQFRDKRQAIKTKDVQRDLQRKRR